MDSKRRSFLKFAPVAAVAVTAPIAATAVVSLIPAHTDPMRGKTAEGTDWSMIRLDKRSLPGGDSAYTSSHMERRADGKYVMVYDRDE